MRAQVKNHVATILFELGDLVQALEGVALVGLARLIGNDFAALR